MRWAVLCLALTGCYSITTSGRARTLEQGKLEVMVAPEVTATAVVGADPNIRPAFELGLRYGLTPSVELGVRGGDSGGAFSTRIQLLRSASRDSGVDLLIAPGVAYTVPDKAAFELPVLLGFNFPGGHQLVLAPRVVQQFAFTDEGLGHPARFTFVGGSVGFVWQVFSHVALMPEIGVLTAIDSEPGYSTYTHAGPALQGAVGVLIDP